MVHRTRSSSEDGKGPAHSLAQVDTTVPDDATLNTTNTYTYDAAGNVATRTTRAGTDTFTFGTEGKLAKLASTGTSGTTTYLYDADGNLLIRRGPDAATLYTGDEEVTLKNGAGTPDAVRYISIAGQTVATHSSDGHVKYLISDRQGTGSLQIDAQTQAVVRRQYKPFGEARDHTGTWTGQQGYVGGTQDDNTGLTNLGAREYDSTVGRFLSPDPLFDPGDPQSWNAYSYADDNPTSNSDPTGLRCLYGAPGGGADGICEGVPGDHDGDKPNSSIKQGDCNTGNSSYCNSIPHGYGDYSTGQKRTVRGATKKQLSDAAAAERAKATADATLAAAKKQKQGLIHQVLNLVGDLIGINDAVNCFTKGDAWGCISTALNFVPWGKVFKAIKVGYEAYKVWRALDKAYTAVKDAEDAVRVANKAVKAEHAALDADRGGAEAAASCSVHSFTATTPVRLADGGSKPIDHVRAGDTVLATDPQTGVTAPEKVQRLIVTTTDSDFTTLTVDTALTRGPPAHTAKITTTWHHPFWDATRHRWTDAHDLKPGTRLRREDGTTVTLLGVRNNREDLSDSLNGDG